MQKSPETVFLFLILVSLFTPAHSKDLLLHTIQYHLSSQKLLTMATLNLHNEQLPAFVILEPHLNLPDKNTRASTQLISQEQAQQDKQHFNDLIKSMIKTQFHIKLPHPIKVLIHNQYRIEQQCYFDEPWDLCMIQNPQKRKSLDFSIHCLLDQSLSGVQSGSCDGKFTIRQSDLTQIDNRKYQEKIKYESGLFELPDSEGHSVMLISCQDDDLPLFTDSLKIFSTSKYHRYERDNSEQVKELVGFDKTSRVRNWSKQIDEKKGSEEKSVAQYKRELKDRRFVYLDVREEMVRKCVQFQFYRGNKLIKEEKVFDFMNLTDTEYKNVYSISRVQTQKKGEQQVEPKNQEQGSAIKKQAQAKEGQSKQPLLKYNLQLTLDIFKPLQIAANQAYDVRIKLIDGSKHATVLSYTFPLAINSHSTLLSTALYSKSNHYHFNYVVGHQFVKDLNDIQVQVDFEAKHTSGFNQQSANRFFFFTLSADDTQNVLVEKLITTHLTLKQNQHLTFFLQEPYEVDQITTSANAKPTDLVQILPSSSTLQIQLSQHSSDHQHTNECHFSQGCKFDLDVSSDCLDCKIDYRTSFIKSPNDMLMLEIKESIFEGKIDLDQIQFFYKRLEPQKITELIINTPNIIVYTLETPQDQKKCSIPKKSCHTQVATSHQRIILSNSDKTNDKMIFLAIEGLDKTRFSVLFVNSDKILNVMNGVPFTYKLPQQKESIQLLFTVPSFEVGKSYENNITFNLISPLNSLQMDIIQLKEDESELQAVEKSKTMSGFIKLWSKNVKSHKIKITLSKTNHYLSHPVHFTLIASTSDHKFRLDTGITHYESFDSAEQKTFVIEFEDQHKYQLNLHLYDTPEKQIAFSVAIFNPNQVRDNKKTLNYKISQKQWVIVLDDQLVDKNDLCPDNDPECTLFVTVSSMMAHEVEIAMTLLTTDSVMELKDGLWQTFRLDHLLMRTHFYFTPTHDSNPVKIFFKSSNPNIFISAVLYDNSQNVNPAEWPFPQTHGHSQQANFQFNQNYMFKSNHLIQLDNEDPEFKKCFPNCVVLLSILDSGQKKPEEKVATDQKAQASPAGTLSILASNNHIQLPQKLRLTLELKQSEQQLIYIDLKHAFKEKRQVLTFFSNMIVGYGQIYAKLYLPSLQNLPDKDDYDILFDPLKTQITLLQLRDIFMQSIAWLVDVSNVQEILQKQQLYLALFILAEQPTKMTLEYTTDYEEITQLSIDSVQTVSLEANQQKLFQFYPIRDQKIRFIRTKGYPLFHQFKCDAMEGGFDSCLKNWLQRLKLKTEDDIRNIQREREVEKQLEQSPKLTDKKMIEMAALSSQQQFSQYQILKKTQTQHVIECQRCIIFIWIYAMQPAELTIQIQSLTTQTLIKENQMLTDYVEPNEYHRYYLPRVQKELSTIVVSVNEGNPVVTVSDNLNFEQTKKATEVKDDGRIVLLFTVPPAKILPENHPNTKTQASFNKIFSNLHISITPEDSKPVSYTLSYSSGMHEIFLKNGVISTQYLFENENATFYYKNQNKSIKSYLTLTVQAPFDQLETILNGIQIKMFSLSMDQQKGTMSKNEIASQRPSSPSNKFKKQTTLTYELPPFEDLQIDIMSEHTTKITIGLTNGKIIFLPLDYEYPVFLEAKEEIKFVVENNDLESDIEFVIKKCDQSNPSIFYTLEQKQFENNIYSNYDKFGSENIFRHVTKTRQKQSVYIKLKADPKSSSTLVIRSGYVFNIEQNFVDLDPGNMGLIEYQFENLNQLRVKFEGLQCGKECAQVTEYYLVRAKSMDSIYKELVCAGEAMVKLFEKKTPKSVVKASQGQGKDQQAISLLLQTSQDLQLQKIQSQPSEHNKFQLLIPYIPSRPIVSIKSIYKPTGEESFYKPTLIKTLQSSVTAYSSQLVMVFAGAVFIALVVLIVITQKLSRRGYVHVGQDQTMVV